MKSVSKIHKFRELVDNLYTHSSDANDDMKSIHECLVDTKQCYDNAKEDTADEDSDVLTDMEGEIQQMEKEYQKAQAAYNEHITNICGVLKQYQFIT